MGFRFPRRRLTIGSATIQVPSRVPKSVRWLLLLLCVMLGSFVIFWFVEIDQNFTNMLPYNTAKIKALKSEVLVLQQERDIARIEADTANTMITAEKATQEKLAERIKKLEIENQSLRDDLQFFENLIPTNGRRQIAIRGLQVDRISTNQLRWQVLLIQPIKNAPVFKGEIHIIFTGMHNGESWSNTADQAIFPVELQQYKRLSGVLDIPSQIIITQVTAKLLEKNTVRSVESVDL